MNQAEEVGFIDRKRLKKTNRNKNQIGLSQLLPWTRNQKNRKIPG